MYVEINTYARVSLFRNIFNTNFNLDFGSPRTDVCSNCLQFEEKIKRTTDLQQKNDMIMQKRVHRLRANAVYLL